MERSIRKNQSLKKADKESITNELTSELIVLIEELTEDEKTLFLYNYAGLTQEEIAKQSAMTTGEVRTHLREIKAYLKKRIQEKYGMNMLDELIPLAS